MPIYLYECSECDGSEEHVQKFSDPPVTVCESCGGKLARVMAPSAAHFKGGGWANEGYASTRKKKD